MFQDNHFFIIQPSTNMINAGFTEDMNFTNGNFDIKELTAFMNEKKRRAEKEATKYDVDRDTQAKASNVQHLQSMSQYLPLFTKKIRDPKALKNQRTTKEIDYTRNKDQLAELQRAQEAQQRVARIQPPLIAPGLSASEGYNEEGLSPMSVQKRKYSRQVQEQEDAAAQENQSFKKFSPGTKRGMPLIEESDDEQQMQQQNLDLQQMSLEQFMESVQNRGQVESVEIPTPAPANRGSSRPGQEMLAQANQTDRENLQLRLQVEEKRRELEAINYKYAKAQAKLIETMRELHNFREDFNDHYSMRSKMLRVQAVTEQIDNLLDVKEYMLATEEKQLAKFITAESMLFDASSPSPQKKKLIAAGQRERSTIQVETIIKIGQTLGQMCRIEPSTRVVKISNVLCLASCSINKSRAECQVTLYTKVSQERLSFTFMKITERFDPWKEIHRLRLTVTEDGALKVYSCDSLQEKRIIDVQESPYKGVENQIVKYIHGSPVRLLTLSFYLMNAATASKRTFQISVIDSGFNRAYCTVDVSEERLFKEVVPPTIANRSYEAELRSLLFRRDAVQYLISRYIRRYLQTVIVGVDISEQQILLSAGGPRPMVEVHGQEIYGSIGVVDREARSLKFRHSEFPGLRVPFSQLAVSQNNNGSMSQSPAKQQPVTFTRIKGKLGTSGKNMFAFSHEKMKAAVLDHLSKKKDFSLIANPVVPNMPTTPSTVSPTSPSKSPRRRSSTGHIGGKKPSTRQVDAPSSKMQQIMKLIHANSMFMHIHSELYFHERDDFPAYLEIVHNTDDDSLLLFVIDDPRDCFVREVALSELADDENWQAIQQRYGINAEQVLCNVETIFRSMEFLTIIRGLIASSRRERNYGQLSADDQRSPSGGETFRIHVNQ